MADRSLPACTQPLLERSRARQINTVSSRVTQIGVVTWLCPSPQGSMHPPLSKSLSGGTVVVRPLIKL